MTTATATARVLLVQWAGDYREAYRRLSAGGAETYYAQRYSVEQAGELAGEFAAYGVMCLTGPGGYDEELPDGVRAMSAGPGYDPAAALDHVRRFRPTHLVVTTPQPGLLAWAVGQGLEVLPLFADTFGPAPGPRLSPRRLVRRWRQGRERRRLAGVLGDPRVRWVGNHNVGACRALADIGVPADKLVPWDWPPVVRPDEYEPKRPAGGRWELAYAGGMVADKGLGDAIAAVGELRRRGRAVRLRVIGRGDDGPFRRLAAGLGDAVEFAGPRPHAEVLAAFRAADLVLVPSRHAFPEGVPMTLYEAFAVRTPVVCSDHPAFRDRVGAAATCVPERSPAALADAVERLLTDAGRYVRASEATADVWAGLVCPVRYYDLIRRWASNDPADDRWLATHALASGRYR